MTDIEAEAKAGVVVNVEYHGHFLASRIPGHVDGSFMKISTVKQLEVAFASDQHQSVRLSVDKLKKFLDLGIPLVLVYMSQASSSGHDIYVPQFQVTDKTLQISATGDLSAYFHAGLTSLASELLVFSNPQQLPIDRVQLDYIDFDVFKQPELQQLAPRAHHEAQVEAYDKMCKRLPIIHFD